MLKKVTFTPVTIQILEFLAQDPNSSFHSRDVARSARVSSGAASLTLRKLQRAQLLSMEKKGKMKFYRVDLSNPVSRQFKVLFNLQALGGLLEALKEDTDRAILFGSCAEGTDAKDSDMDLFILTQDDARVKDILRMFRNKLHRNLSPIIVDGESLTRLRKEDKALHESISRGIILWQRE